MSAEPPASNPFGFAVLAKRISVWTTRGLLTVIVLLAGLGFGRQVLKWWAADATPSGTAANLAPDGLGDQNQLHTLQFGDSSWSLQRRSFTGGKDQAVEQLRAACRDALQRVAAPAKAADKPGERTPGERKFLAFLSSSTPFEQQPDKWRIYELHDPLPMAVGVARTGEAGQAFLPVLGRQECPPHPSQLSKPNLAEMGYHVVIWALAVPAGPGGWTLCTFQPDAESASGRSGLADVPLPPGGHRTLSMQSAGGGIVAFSGPDRPAQWKRFYDDWFARHGWQAATGWQPTGAAWYAKFAAPDRGDSIDIRFGPDGRSGFNGLLMTSPRGSK